MTANKLGQRLATLPLITLAAGDILFEQGSLSEGFYFVQSGRLGVRVGDQPAQHEIDVLSSGAVVGELGALSGRPRTATVYALEDSKLRLVSAESQQALSAEFPDLLSKLTSQSRPRWQRLQLAKLLNALFGELDAATLRDLQEQLKWRSLKSEHAICRQGDLARSMYLIVNGRVRIYLENSDGSTTHLGYATRGETIGEFALLSDGTRSATVEATRDTDIVEISQSQFEALSLAHPILMRSIAKIIVDRQRRIFDPSVNSSLIEANLTMLLLPADPTTDLTPFAAQLAQALSQYGSTLVIDAATFDAQFGYPGAAQTETSDANHTATVSWLNEQESNYDYLIFLPDAGWTAWTQRCVGQSDRALIVGRPGDAVVPQTMELALDNYAQGIQRELVLWHSAETAQPKGTIDWLNARSVTTHHHIRDQDAGHFGRLARRLSGRAICLTLSGGGARGFVHLGAFQAFEESKVPIDYVGGTSFGALMGVGRALEWGYEKITAQCAISADNKKLFDRTLPVVALNDSLKVTETMQLLYEDWQIEDCWIPFFAIATNLTQARMEVIDRGPIWLAIRQSVSIPGVFAPVIVDGDVIVDGGVMNNFPVDVMRNRAGSARIIGVHCAPSTVRKREYDLETNVSGWSALGQKLNPMKEKRRLPSITNTIMRSFDVNSLSLARQNELLCELLLQPEPTKFSILDFEVYRDIAALGYERSVEPVHAWAAQQDDI